MSLSRFFREKEEEERRAERNVSTGEEANASSIVIRLPANRIEFVNYLLARATS